jgi:ribonuclease I
LDWIALRFDGNAEYYRGKTKVQVSRLLVVKPTTGSFVQPDLDFVLSLSWQPDLDFVLSLSWQPDLDFVLSLSWQPTWVSDFPCVCPEPVLAKD